MKYFDGFTDHNSLKLWFGYGDVNFPEGFPTEDEILFASYGQQEAYSGQAITIYQKDGKLYEVNGGHCSCYGLEDQWVPEETSWEALAMRQPSSSDFDQETKEAFKALVESHLSKKD